RDLDVRTERRLREAHRSLADDVGALACEQRMVPHVKHDVEIAGGGGAGTGLALAAELQARAVVDAGGDLDVQLLHAALRTVAAARRARVRDDRSLAVAVAARFRDREEALLEADLAGAAALRARARARARLCAPPAARLARREARDRDRLLAAERGFLEGDLELVAEIVSASPPPASAAAAPRPEEVAEEVADDVLEAG